MNWDQLEGKWKQYSGKAKEKWGKLTDDDLTVIHGRRDQLIGKIQERYGMAKQEAEKQVDEFARSFREDSRESPRGDHEGEIHSNVKEKKHGAGQS
ncbi:MAG TPA: CsbD family protein [Candidatus Acidoferrum sp.]|nr:CsbD family protein [Candidatus Acidoferrum sp.]